VRAIGVSNFMPEHLSCLLAAASVVPSHGTMANRPRR
jgi:diketogulonate reductase-like aldo/keto reductase